MTEGRITSRSPHEVNEPLLSVCYGAVVPTAAADVVLHSNTCTRRESDARSTENTAWSLHNTQHGHRHNTTAIWVHYYQRKYPTRFFGWGRRMVESSVGKMYAGNHWLRILSCIFKLICMENKPANYIVVWLLKVPVHEVWWRSSNTVILQTTVGTG